MQNEVSIMTEKKEKQYVSDNARLMAEWNWERNTDLDPSKLTLGSGRKAWWRCSKGHEWQATIDIRNKGIGCPYCSGRNAVKGENDLQTVNPSLAKEWNYEKNSILKPEDFTAHSGKKVWWKCKKGHEWQATINSRASGKGCPYCSNKKTLQGYNDLATLNSTLAKEWNCEKNGNLTPESFTTGSGKKVWWKCEKGHEWLATICDRNNGNKCPYCLGLYTIRGETDLQTVNPTLAKEWNYEKNGKLSPMDVLPSSNKKVWWKCKKGHEWQAIIESRNSGRGCPICNAERTTSLPEYAIVYYLKKYGLRVIHSYRELGYELDIYIPAKRTAIEYDGGFWHKGNEKKDLEKNQKCKNDGVKLYRLREGLPSLNDSSIDFIVQEKQRNLSQVLEKILSELIGISIDVDLERDAIEIENLREYTEKESSLSFSNPTLASEWNYEKNGNLKPEHFSVSSGKKVWWKCQKGHEWQATIANRNNGRGCPYCSGKSIMINYNDLQAINPALSAEWNNEKNGGLMPEHFAANSGKKVWWKCQKGHEWQATIASRNSGRECPYCTGKIVVNGETDLYTINPSLAQEWNYEKNKELTPTDVFPNSHKKVWWKCDKGHEWQAEIKSRNRGNGCPYCSGRKKTT